VVATDVSDRITSYTQSPNRSLRTAAVILILENHRIIIINPLDPMSENVPVAIGTKTSALISVGEYMMYDVIVIFVKWSVVFGLWSSRLKLPLKSAMISNARKRTYHIQYRQVIVLPFFFVVVSK